jgi:hypothetical protein
MEHPCWDVVYLITLKQVVCSNHVKGVLKTMTLTTPIKFYKTTMKSVVEDFDIMAGDYESAGSIVYECIILKSDRTGLRITATAYTDLGSPQIAAIEYEAIDD